MPKRQTITRDFLRSILDYDPETGVFTWKARPVRAGFERTDKAWNSRRIGTVAGTVNFAGYVAINLFGVPQYAHRLAFIYMTGEAPEYVDHINRYRADNRWANLRPATNPNNSANAKLRDDNTSGYRGVTWYEPYRKWMVRLWWKGAHHFVGYFDDVHVAGAAYESAARKLHGEFYNPDR